MRVTVAPGAHLIGLWDASLLRRLVANLVGNALKYSPADQPVEVEVGPGEGPTARLSVRDHGIGMAPDELDRVFERFARTDRARQSGAAGLGSRAVCLPRHRQRPRRHHRGRHRRATTAGTTVTVTLPTMDEELAGADD